MLLLSILFNMLWCVIYGPPCISTKKCEIFSSIFALKFCESGVFSSARNRHFCFPPLLIVDSCGSWRLALVCCTKRLENLQNSDKGPFFFEDQHKIGEKDASVSTITFFFFFLRSQQNQTKR